MSSKCTWDKVERLAKKKGYCLECFTHYTTKMYRIRRLNWSSSFYLNPEGLEFYLKNKAIDWGKGYVP